jgi:hypothetical protein
MIRTDQVRKLVDTIADDVDRQMHSLEKAANSRAFEFEPQAGELRYVVGRSDIAGWQVELRIVPV